MNSLNNIIQQARDFRNTPERRRKAIEQLQHYPVLEVVKEVTAASIVDPDLTNRRMAVEVLRTINPRAAHEIYLEHLSHRNPGVLENAIHALKQLGYNRQATIAAVAPLMSHPDHRVRKAATATVQRLTAGHGRGTPPGRSGRGAPPTASTSPRRPQRPRMGIIGRSSAAY